MAVPITSGGGMSSAAPSSAAQVRLQAKRPRRCFTTEEDLAILREVAATKPFGDDLKWIEVIENLKRVLGRELTLRGLRDRVDLLIGYWRQEDTRNLKKWKNFSSMCLKTFVVKDDIVELCRPKKSSRSFSRFGYASRRRGDAKRFVSGNWHSLSGHYRFGNAQGDP
ncbi:hypothetical protein MTO96_050175 [Rhipicephalus appendiculatus]